MSCFTNLRMIVRVMSRLLLSLHSNSNLFFFYSSSHLLCVVFFDTIFPHSSCCCSLREEKRCKNSLYLIQQLTGLGLNLDSTLALSPQIIVDGVETNWMLTDFKTSTSSYNQRASGDFSGKSKVKLSQQWVQGNEIWFNDMAFIAEKKLKTAKKRNC